MLTYKLGDLPTEIQKSHASKIVYEYLTDLLKDHKYDNKEFCKRVTILQFIKFKFPSFKPWEISNQKFMRDESSVPMFTEDKPTKEDFKAAEEFVFKQGLENKMLDHNNYELMLSGEKQMARIYARNPILVVETLDYYIKSIFSETNLKSLAN